MKKIVLLLVSVLLLVTNANAFDVRLLANNKEANSRLLSANDLTNLQQWIQQHRLEEAELKSRARIVLQETMNEEEKIDTTCEVGLITRLTNKARSQDILGPSEELHMFSMYLRKNDMIDDIFFRLLKDSTSVRLDLINRVNARLPFMRPNNSGMENGLDIKKLYEPFQTWPDDVKTCTLDTYFNMVVKLTWKTAKERDTKIKNLNYHAYRQGVIDLAIYNKLEVLRNRAVLEWPITFKRYIDVVNNAKDKLTKNPEISTDHTFSEKYVSRKERLTQRGRLFKNFNSTQIMMLAQIIERTAKRMDAKQVSLNWQYTEDPQGETEVYIFSPMEQYRAAIKMLRKEMGEVMRSEAFKNTGLEYDDLIAAAYETGFIKSEELDYVLKFEDFWNPQNPKWKTYASFAFSLAGTATFYLPPPWNIIGAVALVLTQSKVMNVGNQPDPDDNWNVII
ncbi:hypothetical protein [Peredibacter starrii]|uniref:Uncharacterized protein n=1 Tax=Peredibacter starrii TaxID=28202 RepID=A0AAX4HRS2_9BACT|nr:hypothetical protein [Peredibacter starrii]WPU65932.1 hypothetical protein SOO65_04160 [Peredibacter starrii]